MKHKKEFTGIVKSVKMKNTVIVGVPQIMRHPKYLKIMRFTHRFAADVGQFTLAVGDTVKIQESKPISKTKHFVVIEKVSL